MSQIVFGDATESSVVIEYGVDRFDQSVVNRFAVGGDDHHAQRFAAFRRVAHLAIQRVNSAVAVGRLGLPSRANESSQVFQAFANVPFVHGASGGIGVPITTGVGRFVTSTLVGSPPVIGTIPGIF